MALNVLGKQFDKLLNVTLCYPDNNRQPFFDMLSGKLTRIVVMWIYSLLPMSYMATTSMTKALSAIFSNG